MQIIEEKTDLKTAQKKTLAWVEELRPLFKGKTLTLEEIDKAIGKGLVEKQKRINSENNSIFSMQHFSDFQVFMV